MTSAAIGERSRAGQRDVREQRVALERLDDRGDAVVPADAQVVALRDVVGEHDPRALAQPREHGQQHAALERLRLVDDDEGVVQRPAADVRQRQHLQQPAGHDLLDDGRLDERARGCRRPPAPRGPSSRRCRRAGSRGPGRPRRTAGGRRRPSCAPGAPAPTRGRRTARARTCPCRRARRGRRCRPRGRAAGRWRCAARRSGRAPRRRRGRRGPGARTCRARPGRGRCPARTAAPGRCASAARGPPSSSTLAVGVEQVEVGAGDLELGHAGPAGVHGELGAVLLRGQADGRRP